MDLPLLEEVMFTRMNCILIELLWCSIQAAFAGMSELAQLLLLLYWLQRRDLGKALLEKMLR